MYDGSCAVRIEERGRLPALHANATAPSWRRLGAVGASGNRFLVLGHRKSERDVRYSLVRQARAHVPKVLKKELALFSLGSDGLPDRKSPY